MDTFPEDPWSVDNSEGDDELNWSRTDEEAFQGVNSIKPPDLSNDEFAYRDSTVELALDPDWGRGTLTFSVLSNVNFPADALYVVLGGADGTMTMSIEIEEPTDGWETFELEIEEPGSTVVFLYAYNPMEEDEVGEPGGVYIDEVYFVPSTTPIPTYSPTEPMPTYAPTLSA